MLVVALATVRQLQIARMTEDCVLAGRSGCTALADKLCVTRLFPDP